MKVSIVIPVYNVEKYLARCIQSVINQTYENIEIILVDDGSMDSSGKLCDTYKMRDNRIKVIHQRNLGVSAARNVGLDLAEGDSITFIDADDYVAENFYKIIYAFLTIFLYLLKCPQSLILSALRAFCFCGKPHISRSIFLYFRYQTWLKSW